MLSNQNIKKYNNIIKEIEILEQRSLFLIMTARDLSQNPNYHVELSVYHAKIYDNYEKIIALRNKGSKLYITTT